MISQTNDHTLIQIKLVFFNLRYPWKKEQNVSFDYSQKMFLNLKLYKIITDLLVLF